MAEPANLPRPPVSAMPAPDRSARGLAGIAAGLAAGMLLSAAWLGIEAGTGETAEVVRLGRLSLARGGRPARPEAARPSAREQVMSHGGHLALSAVSGGLYGIVAPAEVPSFLAGAGFGAGYYAVCYGVLAPVLGLRPPMWEDARAKIVQRGFFHLLFGVLIAVLTPSFAGRLIPASGVRPSAARFTDPTGDRHRTQ